MVCATDGVPISAVGSGINFLTMDDAELIQLLDGKIARPIHVCDMEPELASAINALTTTVLLSPYTIEKQRNNHPELDLGHYRLLPDIIRYGLALRDSPRSINFYEDDRPHFGNLWQVCVKVIEDGSELYVTSFHPLKTKMIMKAHNRGKKLRYRVNNSLR